MSTNSDTLYSLRSFIRVVLYSRAMDEQPLDVGAIMAQLRAEVRAAQGLLEDTTPHLALGMDLAGLAESVAEVEALRAVSVHWPLQWQTPRERVLVFAQRLIRRALRFYLEPIVQQQNSYNAAVARAVNLLYQSQQALAADLARLKQPVPADDNA